jgi:hypothetical protein
MQSVSTILAYLAFAGAIASWIVGAVLCVRTLSAMPDSGLMVGLAVVAWPFTIARVKGAGAEPATQVNKALVAFLACMLIGVAAFSASTNLHRFAK